MICNRHKQKFPDIGSIHEGDEEFELRYYLFGEGVVLNAEQAIRIREMTADCLNFASAFNEYEDYADRLRSGKHELVD